MKQNGVDGRTTNSRRQLVPLCSTDATIDLDQSGKVMSDQTELVLNWLIKFGWLGIVKQPQYFVDCVSQRQQSTGCKLQAACLAEIGIELCGAIKSDQPEEIDPALEALGRYIAAQLHKKTDRKVERDEAVVYALSETFRRRHKIDSPEALLDYTATIAFRYLIKLIKDGTIENTRFVSLDEPIAQSSTETLGDTIASPNDLEHEVLDRIAHQCVWKCLENCKKVSDRDRIIFVAIHILDMTVSEVSQRTGMQTGAIYTVVSRAKKAYSNDSETRKCIQRCLEE